MDPLNICSCHSVIGYVRVHALSPQETTLKSEMYIRPNIYLLAYIHACIHTYIHTHTHTHRDSLREEPLSLGSSWMKRDQISIPMQLQKKRKVEKFSVRLPLVTPTQEFLSHVRRGREALICNAVLQHESDFQRDSFTRSR